jgi:hypothetical protein
MNAAAPDGSITEGRSPRADLLVFEVRGRITKPDIEWMARLVDEAFDRLGEVDMLILMRDYQGVDAGAALDLEALGVQARALRHVRRYGVVGAPAWARLMIEVVDPITPVDARTFDVAYEADAWAWIGPGPG